MPISQELKQHLIRMLSVLCVQSEGDEELAVTVRCLELSQVCGTCDLFYFKYKS